MGVVCWSNAIFSGKSQPSFTGCDADLDSLRKCSTGEAEGEMEMLTRCILGNNTWGKLGQCAADVDIGWSAGGATISSCHLRGRSAAGVEEGHVEGLLLHTTRLP